VALAAIKGEKTPAELAKLFDVYVAIRAADTPGADELMLRIYAAMAQKERELMSERARAALAAAEARGMALRSSEAEPSFDALEHSNARNGPPQAAFTFCETYAASAA
jgi:hypothetical protein